MTANTDGILDYLREFKNAVQEGTDIFTVGEANGVSDSDLPQWVGEKGVLDMVFEFSHINIDLPDEMNWCETRAWTLRDFNDILTGSQETTAKVKGWYPVFLENHDQPRSINRYLPGEADRNAGGKALGTLLLTMRGTPFIMAGEELGFVNVEWPSIDAYEDISTKNHYTFALHQGYSEEEALKGVHQFSRDSARTPMQWDSSGNAGFTTGTPWLPVHDDYEVCNVESAREDPDSILNWYITLAALRQEHSELLNGDYQELLGDNDQILAYSRANDTAKAFILINFTNEEAAYDASVLGGAELLISTNGQNEKGVLAPLEAVIYEVTAD